MLITSSYKSFVFARTSHVSPVLNVNKCSRSFQVLKIYVVQDPKYRNKRISFILYYYYLV